MLELTSENFQTEVLNETEKAVLVDFWAPWCGPCRMQTPVLQKFSDLYGGLIKTAKLNTDEHEDIARRYGIMSIPTLIVFKNGVPAQKAVGAQNLEGLKKLAGI